MNEKRKETLRGLWLIIFIVVMVIVLAVTYFWIVYDPWPIPGIG